MNTITIDITDVLIHYIIPYIFMCIGWYYIITYKAYDVIAYKAIYITWSLILGLTSVILYNVILFFLSTTQFNIIL